MAHMGDKTTVFDMSAMMNLFDAERGEEEEDSDEEVGRGGGGGGGTKLGPGNIGPTTKKSGDEPKTR